MGQSYNCQMCYTVRMDTYSQQCRKCQQYKTINEFYVASRNSSGHEYICKQCRNKIRIWQRTLINNP